MPLSAGVSTETSGKLYSGIAFQGEFVEWPRQQLRHAQAKREKNEDLQALPSRPRKNPGN
jgi:hypothetical protein